MSWYLDYVRTSDDHRFYLSVARETGVCYNSFQISNEELQQADGNIGDLLKMRCDEIYKWIIEKVRAHEDKSNKST